MKSNENKQFSFPVEQHKQVLKQLIFFGENQ